MLIRLAAVFLCFALTAAAGPPVSLTGAWRLNIGKSIWGSRPKPVSVTLRIDHSEPSLTYSGVVIYSGEDARTFHFAGAIDGKPYEMDRSFGHGTVTLRRVDAFTFESEFRSGDGRSVETTRTTISSDGRTLTRRIRVQTGESSTTCTEVYDRF